MGLREKVALLTFTFISTQIVWNHCMPRGYSNYSFTPQTKSPMGSGNGRPTRNNKFLKNEALRGSCNDSAVIRFPDVEYPFESQHTEYYRFLNDYPIQLQSKDFLNNSSFQAPSYEREVKCKRKQNRVTNVKTTPDIKNSFTDYDPLPQPYCFRKSNFFPEVEYPLSSRDMWIPKYWSRLQDAKRKGKVDMAISSQCSAFNTDFPDYGSNYANSPLSTLIKTLNTNKVLGNQMSNNNNFKLPIFEEEGDFVQEIISSNSSNGDIDLGLSMSKTEIVEATNADNTNIAENVDSLDNITSSAIPMSSTAGKHISGDIITTNSDTQHDMIPELSIAEENKNGLDNLVQSLTGEASTDDGESELSIPKKDSFDGIIKTSNIENGELLMEMPILNKDNTGNIIPITQIAPITNANSEVFPESDISRTEINSNNTNFIDQSLIPENYKDSPDNIFTAMPNIINDDVRSEPTILNKDLSDTTLTALPNTEFSNNSNTAELPIFTDEENEIISITPSTGTGCTIADICALRKDSITNNTVSTNSKNTDTNSELPIFKETTNGSHPNILTTTAGLNKSEILSPVIADKATIHMTCPSDNNISTTTPTENCDLVPKKILMESKTSLDNIVKILPITDIISNIKSEPIDMSEDSINDIVNTMINADDHISELSIARDDKLLHNNITNLPSKTTYDTPLQFSNITSITTSALPSSTVDMFDSTKQTSPMFTSKSQCPTNNIEISKKQTDKTSAGVLPISNTPDPFLVIPDSITSTPSPITRKETTGLSTLPMISEVQCVDNIQLTTPMPSECMTLPISGSSTLPGDVTASKSENKSFVIGDDGNNNQYDNVSTSDVQAKNDQLSESSINLDNSDAAEYINDSWLLVYDTGSTQDLTANEYEPVVYMLQNNEVPISTANGAVDIMYVEYPNSTVQYEYMEDTEVSYTEMPYDFVLYEFPEYVNDTWAVNANDSYLLYPPIVDYSDDICLLFCDPTNGTTLVGDII